MPTKTMPAWKRDEMREQVEQLISAEALWGKRLPSDRNLAAQLCVNRRTLQKALADLEAQGLIERRHGSGTWVRDASDPNARTDTGRLAIITERHFDLDGPWQYHEEMIRGTLAQGRRLKAECTVMNNEDERQRIWDTKEMRAFNGFILVGFNDRLLVKHLLSMRRGPVVLVDRALSDMPVTSVLDGAFEGMRKLVRHLIHLGHQRIALFHEQGAARINREKLDGYHSGLQSAGIDLDEVLLAMPPEPQPVEEYAEHAVKTLLNLESPPTAIVGSRDHRALTLIEILERRGLKVGHDISVAGYGDTANRMGLSDRVTSCRIYPRKLGSEAVRAALKPGGQTEARTIIVPDRLMIRSSTCEQLSVTSK